MSYFIAGLLIGTVLGILSATLCVMAKDVGDE